MLLLTALLVAIINICCVISLHPVLLVPGDFSSQMHAIYKKTPPHRICGVLNKTFPIWLNPSYFFPFRSTWRDCLVQTVKLEYNRKTRRTFPPYFCDVIVPGFGTVNTIEYLSVDRLPTLAYFALVVRDLVSKFGYSPNKDILGAPYDFRKGPNEMSSYLASVKALIERMWRDGGGKRAIIIAHSMGNLHMVRLFNSVTQQWKDKYIETFISISAPYAGSIKSVYGILTGFRIPYLFYIKPQVLQSMGASWPSSYYLLPSPSVWSQGNIVLTKYGNFTAQTLKKVLELSKIENSVEHYENVVDAIEGIRAPNVTMHCIYSADVPTIATLDYSKVDFPLTEPTLIYGLGDGTVNLQSLEQCGAWRDHQRLPITSHVITKVNHFHALTNQQTLNLINGIVANLAHN